MTDNNRKHSFTKSYVKGEALLGGWGIVDKILGAVSIFMLISSLDVFKYGLYILIMAFYSLASSLFLKLLDSVIFNEIVRFISDKKENHAKKLFLETFFIRISIAAVFLIGLLFGASIVANFYGEDIAYLLRILSIMFVIGTVYTSMKTLFMARLKFGLIAVRPIMYKVTKIILYLIFILFFTLGITEALIAHVAASALATAVFIPSFIKLYRPWRGIKPASQKILVPIVFSFGKWPVFNQLLAYITANIRPWLIKFFVNTEAVAIFSVAESMFGVVKSFIPTSTLSSLIPHEISDRIRSINILIRGTKYLVLLALAMAVASFFVVPIVIKTAFPQYNDSIFLFQVLLISLPIISLRSLGVTFMVALRRQRYLFYMNTINLISSFIFLIILLYSFGILGMAFERTIAGVFVAAFLYIYLLKYEVPRSMWKLFFTFGKEDKKFIQNIISQIFLSIKKKIH